MLLNVEEAKTDDDEGAVWDLQVTPSTSSNGKNLTVII
jgi:hypothetical protein